MNTNLSISQTSFKDLFLVEALFKIETVDLDVINLEYPVDVVIEDDRVREQIYLN